jgi:hypothetical protein
MQSKSFRDLWFVVLLAVLLTGAVNTAFAAQGNAQSSRTGTIQQLDFAAGSMILDGYRYNSTAEIQVEIGGSYGAFTMLQVGMKVQVLYRLVSSTQRDLLEVVQIPDNVAIEEA